MTNTNVISTYAALPENALQDIPEFTWCKFRIIQNSSVMLHIIILVPWRVFMSTRSRSHYGEFG